VTAVRKQEGDRVAAGEILAIIDSRELADAKSNYLIAERQVEFRRVTMEREETLWRRKISPERDYLEARQGFEEARLRARLAAQNLVVLGVPTAELAGLANEPPDQASRLAIRTPLAGRVIERTATAGETVNADQSLFVVADLSSVWVDVAVNATDLAAVREGQAVTVRSSDLDRETRGRVALVTAVVGDESRTATARIVVPNPDGQWRPGLFVTALLERESTEAPVVVATEAIQTFRDWQVVFVRYGDWFEARPVELGRSDGKWVEILSGLAAGDEYARENSFVVKAEIGKLGATHDH
jgi:cobalt-zinc-cadmium efflux system membrane fusion protein